MRHPERELREVDKDMTARSDGGVPGEVEGDAAGLAGEGLDNALGDKARSEVDVVV